MTPASRPQGYPEHRKVHVALRDGSTIAVRPVQPSDLGAIETLLSDLSARSSHMRFHGLGHTPEDTLRRFAEVDYRDSFSLVAETGADRDVTLVALASYFRSGPGRAEMALVVADRLQGLG